MFERIVRMITGAERVSDYHSAVFRIFTSEDGKRILDEFICQDYGNPVSFDGMNAETLAYEEGRRAVIKEFLHIVRVTSEKIKKQQELNSDNIIDPRIIG